MINIGVLFRSAFPVCLVVLFFPNFLFSSQQEDRPVVDLHSGFFY